MLPWGKEGQLRSTADMGIQVRSSQTLASVLPGSCFPCPANRPTWPANVPAPAFTSHAAVLPAKLSTFLSCTLSPRTSDCGAG